MAQSGESLEFTLPFFIWIWVCRPLLFSVHQGKKHRTFCTADLQPRWLELTGTKGEEWFRTTLRSLWTSRLQEDFSTTAGCCHHPFQPLHCQDAKKIRRDFFFWLLGQYYSEHILLMDIVDIMELWPNFLFQLQLSVGGEKLASQVVCSWNPARQDNIWTR